MNPPKVLILLAAVILLFARNPWTTSAQGKTTGAITGILTDQNHARIPAARIILINKATGHRVETTTDASGSFTLLLLTPGIYQMTVIAQGFKRTINDSVTVRITETTLIDMTLELGSIAESVAVESDSELIRRDGPQLGRTVHSDFVTDLPLATRNFFQILGLSTGTDVGLPDNTGVGRNSQNISANGARRTQNNFQINGIDANTIGSNSANFIAVPAPETIQEFKVQTSLYDATFGRAGGANLQAITRSGSNAFHGAAYGYFRDEHLNANNPFLKASGVDRPTLRRNVFGATLGGPIHRDKTFFFFSYQGTSERNEASPNSLSSGVLIAPGLTDDRSEQTLRKTFNVAKVHPVSLALLNARLSRGQFLIPTPQNDGRYSGSDLSTFREDQFNANVDYRISPRNWLASKFFFANSPWTQAMFNGPNVPGFRANRNTNHRLVSIQDVHTFNPSVVNETRLGYNLVINNSSPEEPLNDSDFGIRRVNANVYPGLPFIRIAPTARGIAFGTQSSNIDVQAVHESITLTDVLSFIRHPHTIRAGVEITNYRPRISLNFFRRGQIDFTSFNDFLLGKPAASIFGAGISERNLRATDYAFFIHDDWKLSALLTLNLGLRYELDLPFYDVRGRISTFDPSFYRPLLQLDNNNNSVGPPAGGFVQAGNVIPQYDLPAVPNVSRRVLESIDPNNFAPRIGLAYSPTTFVGLVLRSGFGVYYSRISTGYLNNIQSPPYYIVGRRNAPPFPDPFFDTPSMDKFPTFVTGVAMAGTFFDREMRTPYFYQYNGSIQWEMAKGLTLEVAYVGTRGFNLLQLVALNQAKLASQDQPIFNEVTQESITRNTPDNAQLRAPLQGVSITGFSQNQTTAKSSYHSLQVTLARQVSHGLRFLVSYTLAKSVDNASGREDLDSSAILGNQLDRRANLGPSDFNRTHRLVVSYVWDAPQPVFAAKNDFARLLLWNWQIGGVAVAMSGQPIDIVDTGAGSLYGLSNGATPLARPNWVPGGDSRAATANIPRGYFFNPSVFMRPLVRAGQMIPSSNGAAVADAIGTDIGSVGRNILQGPPQKNVDLSIIKRFPFSESKNLEFRAEFFNLFNQVNLANPISDLNAVLLTGGGLDPNTGQIIKPGDFGRITSTSNNPRLIQFGLKINY